MMGDDDFPCTLDCLDEVINVYQCVIRAKITELIPIKHGLYVQCIESLLGGLDVIMSFYNIVFIIILLSS